MENTNLFCIVFQVLRRYFCEKLYNTATSSYISCFTSVFVSADINFYNFLELHLTLSEKCFRHKTDSPKPKPFNGQNLLIFCA